MNGLELAPEERLVPGDLIATLAQRTPEVGPNPTEWPGLTFYRFLAPTAPQWDDVGSLSLCVVAQGRKAVTVDGVRHLYDPFNYLVLNRVREPVLVHTCSARSAIVSGSERPRSPS